MRPTRLYEVVRKHRRVHIYLKEKGKRILIVDVDERAVQYLSIIPNTLEQMQYAEIQNIIDFNEEESADARKGIQDQ